jgi:hypothetical protein
MAASLRMAKLDKIDDSTHHGHWLELGQLALADGAVLA